MKIPYFTKNNIKIKKICCGIKHILAIDENDELYSWGSNLYARVVEIMKHEHMFRNFEISETKFPKHMKH